jgi:L-aspartate oxidase
VDGDGKRFLLGQHELAELAPRDVVAKASYRVMWATGTDHVYLDARHLGGDFLDRRFPTIVATCRAAGIEPAEQLIPVAPAAHYACGGVRTTATGRASLPGLYACGEVACTGIHGANRLASNSLLEGLVFARRIASEIAGARPVPVPETQAAESGRGDASVEVAPPAAQLRQAMSAGAGVLRSGESLAGTAEQLRLLGERPAGVGTREWEFANLLTVAAAVVGAAYARRETRGCHWREDWPEPDPAWLGHLRGALGPDGSFTLAWERT